MHADRTNRVALIVFSLVLLAAGAVGIIASYGLLRRSDRHRHLLDNVASRYLGEHGDWIWPAAAVLALIVLLLSLRWLIALLFSTDRAPDLRVAGGGGPGRTTLVPGALTTAVVDEIENVPGVTSAKARVLGDADDPGLVVTVRLAHDADLLALRHRIVDGPLAHARSAMDDAELPIQLDLLVSARKNDRS